jgi:hypothetical protein
MLRAYLFYTFMKSENLPANGNQCLITSGVNYNPVYSLSCGDGRIYDPKGRQELCHPHRKSLDFFSNLEYKIKVKLKIRKNSTLKELGPRVTGLNQS